MRLANRYTILVVLLLVACGSATRSLPQTGSTTPSAASAPRVLAVETFLADIAQQVAGGRLPVEALIPAGLDPHSFEPTPKDLARIAGSDLLIVNGAGFEGWLERILENTGGDTQVVVATDRLQSRIPQTGEEAGQAHAGEEGHGETDPHFWLDPLLAVRYVENIRDGLIAVDPQGSDAYTQNARDYIGQLQELDGWISSQVAQIPPERRLLVTNHESFGYYADRYGFRIIGAVLPSVSAAASPSARQLAGLVESIRASSAPAIFLETGASPEMAEQIARETGVKVVTGLHTHSVTGPGGEAPSYIEMMRQNTRLIVQALK